VIITRIYITKLLKATTELEGHQIKISPLPKLVPGINIAWIAPEQGLTKLIFCPLSTAFFNQRCKNCFA